MKTGPKPVAPEIRYEKLAVAKIGCWGWAGSKTRQGYGVLFSKGKMIYAHRLSWIIRFGPIPKGMLICHHCDNPECSNPEHLFLGTQSDNLLDMHKKWRHPGRKR
jgi:hypothetical protein